MVCEKRGDVNFHFDTDPIRTRVEDGWVACRRVRRWVPTAESAWRPSWPCWMPTDRGARSGRVSFHRRRGDRPDRRFRPRRGHAEREISDQSRLGGRGPAFHRLRRRNRHGSDDALSSGGGAEELRFFPHRHRRPVRAVTRATTSTRDRANSNKLLDPFPVAGSARARSEMRLVYLDGGNLRNAIPARGVSPYSAYRRATPSAFGSLFEEYVRGRSDTRVRSGREVGMEI